MSNSSSAIVIDLPSAERASAEVASIPLSSAEVASLLQLADRLDHAASVVDLGTSTTPDDLLHLASAALRRQAGVASLAAAEESRLARNLRDEIEAMQRSLNWHVQHCKMMNDHAAGSVWYWQGDGEDHLESLVNNLPVVIRADQLRDLVASPLAQMQGAQPGGACADEQPWMVDGSLVYRLTNDRRPQNCDEIRVQQVSGDHHNELALNARAKHIAGLLNAESAAKPVSE